MLNTCFRRCGICVLLSEHPRNLTVIPKGGTFRISCRCVLIQSNRLILYWTANNSEHIEHVTSSGAPPPRPWISERAGWTLSNCGGPTFPSISKSRFLDCRDEHHHDQQHVHPLGFVDCVVLWPWILSLFRFGFTSTKRENISR